MKEPERPAERKLEKKNTGEEPAFEKKLIKLSSFSLYRFEDSFYELHINGGLAQLGERVLCKHEVIGSSPIFSTIWADSSVG